MCFYFKDLRESYVDVKPLKKKVVDDYYLVSSVWERNNIRYSGIHRLNDKGDIIPQTGLNMDNYEWNNIMEKAEEINFALYGGHANKGGRNGGGNEVLTWSYDYYLNGMKVERWVRNGQTVKFFSEKDARRYGEDDCPKVDVKKTDKLEMRISEEYSPRPNPVDQMELVYFTFLQNGVRMYRMKKCAACQLSPSAPDQKSHMAEGGCLDDIDESDISDYVNCLTFHMKPEYLVPVYNTVCRQLGISPQGSAVLAEAIIEWFPLDKMKVILERDQILGHGPESNTDEFLSCLRYPLRQMIREVFNNLDAGKDIRRKIMGEKKDTPIDSEDSGDDEVLIPLKKVKLEKEEAKKEEDQKVVTEIVVA